MTYVTGLIFLSIRFLFAEYLETSMVSGIFFLDPSVFKIKQHLTVLPSTIVHLTIVHLTVDHLTVEHSTVVHLMSQKIESC
jgi:hypothetical protein